MSHKTLFLQQSYNDSTEQYENLLRSPNVPLWDYVILTASNEAQAEAYRAQIDYRLRNNMLPAKIHYAVLPDPEGKRVGSGGATLNVLRYVHERAGSFENQRILVIHSGGDSKRIPQYSACGKLFSPVPRLLPCGRRSTIFDEFMIGMCGVAARMNAGMLVCSGDVLLLFNPLQIDFYSRGAAVLSIKEPVEIGKNHGVYRKDDAGNVGGFLHKKTVEQLRSMGAVDAHGQVDIDTGATILDSEVLEGLYSLIDAPEKFAAYVNDRARLSFYADFLYPLASQSTLEQYFLETPEGEFTLELQACRAELWRVLHPYSMKLIRMSPAAFIHFGTTWELRRLMTDDMEQYRYLGWGKNINSNLESADYAVSNSYISLCARIGRGSYIEDSYVHRSSIVGENCVVSGVTLNGQTIPGNTVLHGLKLADGRFVVRMYGVEDNPKGKSLMGRPRDAVLWTDPIYPARDSIREAVNATLAACAAGFPGGADCLSLQESFNRADVTAILPWQDKLDDKIKVESLLEAIDRKENLQAALKLFRGGISECVERTLCEEAEKLDEQDLAKFGRKIRIWYALALLTKEKRYMDKCYGTIRHAILTGAVAGLKYDDTLRMARDEVVARLPVRVNWGGGWSDTPPYCLENGGTVLNAAVLLNGERPIKVVVRRTDGGITLASADSGACRTFTEIAELQDSNNPYDPFALHKAALIACGVIPYRENVSVSEITRKLGGGLYLSTQVIDIPRGSGLGTSSILAGACVKALYEMMGRQLPENELYNRVLCMEQIMSTGGGWQDQVGGLTPGIKMVTSAPGIQQRIECVPCAIREDTLRELGERFCLIYTGQRRLARNLLRDVIGRYISGNPEAAEVLYEIQRMAALMRFELEKGNVDGFARLLTEHWALSKKLDAGSTNTCIDLILNTVADLIDGQMICGAGGGGFLQVVLKKGVTAEALRSRLREVYQDSGVDVWRCTFA